ncbi:MAG TPA: hypothetical protein VHS56_12985 [Candidatus Cybelea sp.]|nr:hypothetical protein [Candidatus Cybelea sp.]
MTMPLPATPGVVLIAATALECKALRKAMPRAHVVQTGIALAGLKEPLGDTVVSCGLAGGLRRGLPTGTVVIPREVRRPDGSVLHCDEELTGALIRAALGLRIEPVVDPLLTSEAIVNGPARGRWAALGYAGVDMETGRLRAERVAAVRVILDTPENELSSDWADPVRAMLRPRNWPQARWLGKTAPRAAALCARIVAATQGIGA